MMWKKLLLFALLAVTAVSAGASTIVPVDLATMADRAELIFVGTVLSTESVPVKDGSFAYTYVTFDVEKALKGMSRAGKTITLRIGGGESGTDVYELSGAPKFAVGGKHLLFVEGNDDYLVPLVGWHHGKLDIIASPVNGQDILVDFAGQAVDGVTNKGWRRGGLRVHKDGSLRQPEDPGVTVESKPGDLRVEIPKAKLVDRAEPVGKVLGELRAYIGSRKGKPTFKNSQFVVSASKASVPATFRLEAARATSVND